MLKFVISLTSFNHPSGETVKINISGLSCFDNPTAGLGSKIVISRPILCLSQSRPPKNAHPLPNRFSPS